MSKNKKVPVGTEVVNVAEVATVVDNTLEVSVEMTEGLEGADEMDKPKSVAKIDFTNRAFLESNKPVITAEFASSKYDEERETKVQIGLQVIKELLGDKINPLILLLGAYWEIKPARAAIKKMIDAEAKSLNIPEDYYMQKTLRENVDKLGSLAQAIDRLKYAITYFKPRAGLDAKEVFNMMTINGVPYNVSLNQLAKAKETFGEDKEAIKAHLIGISTKVELMDMDM